MVPLYKSQGFNREKGKTFKDNCRFLPHSRIIHWFFNWIPMISLKENKKPEINSWIKPAYRVIFKYLKPFTLIDTRASQRQINSKKSFILYLSAESQKAYEQHYQFVCKLQMMNMAIDPRSSLRRSVVIQRGKSDSPSQSFKGSMIEDNNSAQRRIAN